MIGVNDQLTHRIGGIIDEWLHEENYIILNNYKPTHIARGTLNVHLANSKLSSLFHKFYVFNEIQSAHYPTLSTYNLDKPIKSQKKLIG